MTLLMSGLLLAAVAATPPATPEDLRAALKDWPTAGTTSVFDDCAGEKSFEACVAARARRAEWPKPQSIVNGGGVSLGSYQAGRLQGLINDARRTALRDLFGAEALANDPLALDGELDTKLNALLPKGTANLGIVSTVGASAGAVNALGMAVEACRATLLPTGWDVNHEFDATVSRQDSVLRRIWMDVGADPSNGDAWTMGASLLDPAPDPNGIFSRQPIDRVALTIGHIFGLHHGSAGDLGIQLRPGCDVDVGMTATSLQPFALDAVPNDDRTSFLSATLPLYVHLSSDAGQDLFRLTPLLEERSATLDTLDALLDVVCASSAIPPMLPPVTMLRSKIAPDKVQANFTATEVTVTRQPVLDQTFLLDHRDPAYALPTDDVVRLIDGGALNNNPLDIATRLNARYSRRHDGARVKTQFFDQDFAEDQLHLYQSLPSYQGNTLWVQYQEAVGDAAGVLTNQQVVSALRSMDTTTTDLVPIHRTRPVTGYPAIATAAFFDRRLRESDFLAGILDGEHEDPSGMPKASWILADPRARSADWGFDPAQGPCRGDDSTCLLARAVQTYVARAVQTCGSSATTQGAKACKDAWKFTHFGEALRTLDTGDVLATKLVDALDTQYARFSTSAAAMAAAQGSTFHGVSRGLDLLTESLLEDLRVEDGHTAGYSDRVLAGRSHPTVLNTFGFALGPRLFGATLGHRFGAWGATRLGTDALALGFAPRLELDLAFGWRSEPADSATSFWTGRGGRAGLVVGARVLSLEAKGGIARVSLDLEGALHDGFISATHNLGLSAGPALELQLVQALAIRFASLWNFRQFAGTEVDSLAGVRDGWPSWQLSLLWLQ